MDNDHCLKCIIEYNDVDSRWRLANDFLYEIVSKYPKHDNEDVIVAKMSIIGRTYAAAVERRKNSNDTPGDFYYDYVAPKLLESEMDEKIDLLKQYNAISEDNLPVILSVHKYLMDKLVELTATNKRSLASKYLHFHLPELFFIYDSRVASVITDFSGPWPRNKRVPADCDEEYARFCYKALSIYNNLNGKKYSDSKTRVVDNILLRYFDEKNVGN